MNEIEKAIANADQMGEHMKEIIAPVIWSYFESLMKKGFTREESLAFTMQFQQILFGSVFKSE